MKNSLRGTMWCLPPMAALMTFGGCAEEKADGLASQAPQTTVGTPTVSNGPSPVAPAPGGPGPALGGPGGPGGGKSSPEIKQIMVRLTKGPNSLTPVIGNELKSATPPWDSIQGQTKEYAQLAADMGKYDPPKGDKDSWAKLSAAYAGLATDLDRAAQARDKDAALAAHGQITNSCNSCHRQHRVMGPGMGGPPGGFRGGPGRGGPGPGPGGPGGGPPG
jgi:hypothetical protein